MPEPRRRRGTPSQPLQRGRNPIRVSILVVILAATLAATAAASNQQSATVSQPAERLLRIAARVTPDVVSVYDTGDVDQAVVDASKSAATSVGASAAPGRTGALGLMSISRNGGTVHAPPEGWLIPFVFTALPNDAATGIWGSDISTLLNSDQVVLNELTATTTRASTGDTINMRSASGTPVSFRVAAIAPYSNIGGADIVMNSDAAARLGAVTDTRMVIWNISSRTKLNTAMAKVGLTTRSGTRVARSWDAMDPDDTISTTRVHAKLGEAWYQFNADGSISMHPTWIARNLTAGRVVLNNNIPINARCHLGVMTDLTAALAEVDAAGLGGGIDVANANTDGGCWNARFSRGSGQIGFLSRHAYGMAIDTNTVTNCQGCVPQMDCRIVRIFRAHGFAWGGNFRTPDGMHFEWVGEPRDQISYPSKYCPNVVGARTTLVELEPAGLAVLTAGEAIDDH